MQTSDFQKEMAKQRPPGLGPAAPALDLKRSSFKQLSKLLKKYEKLGVLTTKAVRKQDHVASVDAGHALVVEFLEKGGGGRGGGGGGGGGESNGLTTAASASALTAAFPSSSAASPDGNGPSSSSSSKKALSAPAITIEPAFRVSPSLRPVFSAPGAPPAPADDLYSEAAVRAALRSYCAAERLSSPTSYAESSVVDKLLLSALFNKGERELAEGGKLLPLAELESRLLARLTRHSRVRRYVSGPSPPGPDYEEKVFRGPPKKISISCEDRQGGRKHVTRVAGVERFALVPAALASTLQREFKTSASVGRASAEEEEVSLQGDVVRELVLFLKREYGIGAEHVEVKGKGGR